MISYPNWGTAVNHNHNLSQMMYNIYRMNTVLIHSICMYDRKVRLLFTLRDILNENNIYSLIHGDYPHKKLTTGSYR